MSYEEIPYDSAPFAETHPEHLAALGRLFGLTPPDPAACRVLEIGCASGGNLIPMAFHLPGSRFLGIDLSASQVTAGQALIQAAGVTNIELRAADIAGFSAAEGPFDYIIAHGVYSWVPQPVRERILEICGSCLSEHGIAYLSYNTLPGWRMRGTLRDMLLHHTRRESAPGRRLALAQEFLAALGRALAGMSTSHDEFLRAEITRIRGNHVSYLFHEYLAEVNQPFLFSEFVADCRRAGLDYVADTELATMLPEILPDEAEALLAGCVDSVEMWQYMDFLVNRNFRQSLLCRAAQAPLREPQLDRFQLLALFSLLTPPQKLDLRRVKGAPFHLPDGRPFEVFHPLTRVALARLHAAYPRAISVQELIPLAAQQLRAEGERFLAEQSDHLVSELFGLYARGAIGATPIPDPAGGEGGASPQAHPLAAAQAALGLSHAAGRRHTVVQLDPFSRALLRRLDGRSGREALVAGLTADVNAQPALRALVGEVEPGRLRRMVEANLERLLPLFARQGLLRGETASPP